MNPAVTVDHDSSQNRPLSTQRRNAIDLLVTGMSITAAAKRLGLARETVSRWRCHDARFIAELNQRREATWANAQNRLRGLVNRAVDVLEARLAAGSRTAAVDVLKATGIYGKVGGPVGPTSPEGVALVQARAEAEKRIRDRHALSGDLIVDPLVEEGEITTMAQTLAEKMLSESHEG